ncbi:hypothetical protein HDZ31DRAFT_32044 [Schizophyllum fasciatum]
MLPSELLELCLDELSDDKPSLAACARVHSSLRSPAQRRLFRDLIVYLHHASTPDQSRLLAALEESHYLAMYVQRCTLIADIQSAPSPDHNPPHALRILLQLSALRVFDGYGLRMSVLPIELEHALAQVLRLPTLQRVALRLTQNFPFHFLRAPALRHVILVDTGHGGDAAEEEEKQRTVWPLLRPQSLMICRTRLGLSMDRMLSWLQGGSVELRGLRALMLDMGAMEPHETQEIVRSAATSLQVLALLPDYHQGTEQTMEMLQRLSQLPFCLPSLRTVVLYVNRQVPTPGGHPRCPKSWDVRLLSVLDEALAGNRNVYPALHDVVILPHLDLSLPERGCIEEESWWAFSTDNSSVDDQEDMYDTWTRSFAKCAEVGILRDSLSSVLGL